MITDAMRVVNGTYGYIHHEGNWLSQYNKATAKVDINKAELKLSGDRWIRHKVLTLKGTGSIEGYKVTDELMQQIGVVINSNNPSYRTELIFALKDPEAWGYERIRLKNVMFDSIDVANWEAGAEIKESWPFTFEGYELVDPLEAD